ncbi:MAG: hypothetical protein ACJAWH_002090, partial [Maribacter sp.]
NHHLAFNQGDYNNTIKGDTLHQGIPFV